jgi:beta-glucosidase/6-phospho-beta-glucosidase/beta-galactosidase
MTTSQDPAEFQLPADFRFGVATAGFQIEGGYNGDGEPANNWAGWERAGRVEPSGIALDFWRRAEEQLDRAVDAGCDAFRLSVEWARCEPADGVVDDTAFDRYAAILDACAERGLQPLVTLHHFTHPAWLGPNFWLTPDSPDRFAAWAALAVSRLATRCRHWVTTNEPNVLALQTYVTGAFPPGRRFSVPSLVRSLDHLMAGHVLAYDTIHRAQLNAVVATNTYAFTVYEIDRLLMDALLARAHGVARSDAGRWLAERREEYYRALPVDLRALERTLRRVAASSIPLENALPRTHAAVYDSPNRRSLDVSQLDYYYPSAAGHLRPPGHRTAGGRNPLPFRMLWDDPPDPAGLTRMCRLDHEPGLDLWVVENGLCNRVRRGRSYPRLDEWDRVRYLREHVAAVVDALDAGLPVTGYYHWTLADNYEWGSYEARFGLYGVDRERGLRWLGTDSMGGAAAAEYRRIADGLRAGDRSVVGR